MAGWRAVLGLGGEDAAFDGVLGACGGFAASSATGGIAGAEVRPWSFGRGRSKVRH